MIDNDIVYAKIGSIKTCLKRIAEVTNLDPRRLEDINVQDIFVLNLQRAVQSAIDLSAHLIASESLGLPSTLKDNFLLLEKFGILSHSLTNRMVSMVGFRNIAIHDYQNLDLAVLKAILTDHLKDLEDFSLSVLKSLQTINSIFPSPHSTMNAIRVKNPRHPPICVIRVKPHPTSPHPNPRW